MKLHHIRFSRTLKSKFSLFSCCALASVALTVPADAVVIAWGGNYVTNSQLLGGYTPGPSSTVVEPNTETGLSLPSGGNDARAGSNWLSDLTPTAGYTGPTIRGGLSVEALDGTPNHGFKDASIVQHGGNDDDIHLHVQGGAGDTHTFRGAIVFDNQDMSNAYFGSGATDFMSLYVSTQTSGAGTHASVDSTVRFLIQEGSNWYISKFVDTGITAGTITMNSSSIGWGEWALYGPTANSLAIDFDQSAASYSAMTFNNVTRSGFYFEHDTPHTNTGFDVFFGGFAAAPEPSRLMLVMGGFLPLLLRRRRR